MKAFVCTIALWVVTIAAYSQSFSVQMPKGLQCANRPTWPVSHSKKTDNLPMNSTTKNNNNNTATQTSKSATVVPAFPLIKLWLMTESKDDDN